MGRTKRRQLLSLKFTTSRMLASHKDAKTLVNSFFNNLLDDMGQEEVVPVLMDYKVGDMLAATAITPDSVSHLRVDLNLKKSYLDVVSYKSFCTSGAIHNVNFWFNSKDIEVV